MLATSAKWCTAKIQNPTHFGVGNCTFLFVMFSNYNFSQRISLLIITLPRCFSLFLGPPTLVAGSPIFVRAPESVKKGEGPNRGGC